MITNFVRNNMGTICFDAKFSRMLKVQEFIVYPLKTGETRIVVQSDTRFGSIDLTTGAVKMSQPHSSGATSVHLMLDKLVADQLSAEELTGLCTSVRRTGGASVGSAGVTADNLGAFAV